MKYCGRCGKPNNDDSVFCSGCGAGFNMEQGYANNNYSTSHTTIANKNKKVGIIALLAVAIVVILGIFTIFGGTGGYKDVIDKYFSAIVDSDVDKLLKVLPKDAIDLLSDGLSEERLKVMLAETLVEIQFEIKIELGGMWDKASYEILEVTDCDRYYIEGKTDEYANANIPIKISDAKILEVEYLFKRNEYEYKRQETLTVIKVGSKWYIDLTDAGF